MLRVASRAMTTTTSAHRPASEFEPLALLRIVRQVTESSPADDARRINTRSWDTVRERTERFADAPPGSWRIDGTYIVTWSEGKLTPSVLMAGLASLSTVVDGIPSFVWHDHGVGGPA